MTALSLPAFLAQLVRKSGTDLVKVYNKLPEAHREWHPTLDGHAARDAYDQLVECTLITGWVASAFKSGSVPSMEGFDFQKAMDDTKAAGGILEKLAQSTEALAAAIGAASNEKLGETFPDPFRGEPMNWADLAMLVIWNDNYHEGQMNYILALGGHS